ncbi:MAG: 30S ribosomal protein S18 [Holosporaceae bacterium]|nr:30S ribosomal protein S18 [Holosporaceae bacterium]
MRNDKKDGKGRAKASWKKSNFRKKSCPFENNSTKADYKDPRVLQKFTSERGKIMPCRISGVSATNQRKLALAVKRARYLALLPYVAD